MPEEKSSKPREMVHKAQALCAGWLHQLHRARQGISEQPDAERAAAELHSATLLYWEQIKRFRSNDAIESLWYEETVFDCHTLDDIGRLRIETEAQEITVTDPDTNTERSEVEQVAWQLAPADALAVIDQLDACANTLGFDARPDRDAPETGAGMAGNEDADEMEFVNSQVGAQDV